MRKILVVEDEALLRESHEIILSTEPYTIHVASDGEKALRLCEDINFDLILLDLMMPKVDGIMFLERYKKTVSEMPKVIIMSNISLSDEISRAIELGATKSVVKANMSPKELLSMIRYELQSI